MNIDDIDFEQNKTGILIQNIQTKEYFILFPGQIASSKEYIVIDSIHNLYRKKQIAEGTYKPYNNIVFKKCSSCQEMGIYQYR